MVTLLCSHLLIIFIPHFHPPCTSTINSVSNGNKSSESETILDNFAMFYIFCNEGHLYILFYRGSLFSNSL